MTVTFVTPKVDRDVIITMKEREATVLRALLGAIGGGQHSSLSIDISTLHQRTNSEAAREVVDELYKVMQYVVR